MEPNLLQTSDKKSRKRRPRKSSSIKGKKSKSGSKPEKEQNKPEELPERREEARAIEKVLMYSFSSHKGGSILLEI